MSRLIAIACVAAGAWGFIVEGNLSAAPKPRPTPTPTATTVDAHSDPDGYTNGNGYVYADANSDPDGYTNGNGYVYADANSVTQALCTRCQCGH